MINLWQSTSTPEGIFTVIATENDVVIAAGWGELSQVIPRLPLPLRSVTLQETSQLAAIDAVAAHSDADVNAIGTVPVAYNGTDFQQRGWQELRRIPAGSTATYRDIAIRLEKPTAARAAASVCARNRIGLFIPCHRVVRANGSLSGFLWGTDCKTSLLRREGITL
ncbi:MAG: methylated-DNA--[protein]-cysteine S-methyltransferase [Propionibacteriaceae bacterium]